MKYEVKMSCGHEQEVSLFGKSSERERKIRFFETQGMCRECYKEHMKEREGMQFNASVLPYIDDKNGSIMVNVWFSGNTTPYKDNIKALGYKWSERTSDLYSVKRPQMCWNKNIKEEDLGKETKKALSIGANDLSSDDDLFATLHYQMAAQKKKEWTTRNNKIKRLKKPDRPAILNESRWNGKIYGKEPCYHIFLDSKRTELTNDEAEALKKYLAEKRAYEKKMERILQKT